MPNYKSAACIEDKNMYIFSPIQHKHGYLHAHTLFYAQKLAGNVVQLSLSALVSLCVVLQIPSKCLHIVERYVGQSRHQHVAPAPM